MQLFNTEYIDIQMMGSLIKVAIQNMYQIIGTLILIVSKRIRLMVCVLLMPSNAYS